MTIKHVIWDTADLLDFDMQIFRFTSLNVLLITVFIGDAVESQQTGEIWPSKMHQKDFQF